MEFLDLDITIERSQLALDDSLRQEILATLAQCSSDEQRLVEIGRRLFHLLFHGATKRRYVEQRARLNREQSLRIRLYCQEPALAALPWELLYDDEKPSPSFLALSPFTPVLRHVAAPGTASLLTVRRPLRLLFVAAAPYGLPRLDTTKERALIEAALASLPRHDLVTAVYVEAATKAALQNHLRQGCDILHFAGHGFLTPQGGGLCLEETDGSLALLTAAELCHLLAGYPLISVVLNSCQPMDVDTVDYVWGLAPQLVQAGVPVVVGMRGDLPDHSAIIFAREFYETLATGYPVVEALTEARKALMLEAGLTQPDWSQPVLFTGIREIHFADSQVQKITQGILRALFQLETDYSLTIARGLRRQFQRLLTILHHVPPFINLVGDTFLGQHLELIAPVSEAVLTTPIFCWRWGTEIIQAAQDVVEIAGLTPVLQFQVTLLDKTLILWQSTKEHQPLPSSIDWEKSAEQVYELACPQAIYAQLQAGRQYRWELTVLVPTVDDQRRVSSQTVQQQATFRVLDRNEQTILQLMVADLPYIDTDDAANALFIGSVYESFALYPEAVRLYEQMLANEIQPSQRYMRLAGLYQKRTLGLLELSDEQPQTTPIARFAAQATAYHRLATTQDLSAILQIDRR